MGAQMDYRIGYFKKQVLEGEKAKNKDRIGEFVIIPFPDMKSAESYAKKESPEECLTIMIEDISTNESRKMTREKTGHPFSRSTPY